MDNLYTNSTTGTYQNPDLYISSVFIIITCIMVICCIIITVVSLILIIKRSCYKYQHYDYQSYNTIYQLFIIIYSIKLNITYLGNKYINLKINIFIMDNLNTNLTTGTYQNPDLYTSNAFIIITCIWGVCCIMYIIMQCYFINFYCRTQLLQI